MMLSSWSRTAFTCESWACGSAAVPACSSIWVRTESVNLEMSSSPETWVVSVPSTSSLPSLLRSVKESTSCCVPSAWAP